jgi:hypothetical protein
LRSGVLLRRPCIGVIGHARPPLKPSTAYYLPTR